MTTIKDKGFGLYKTGRDKLMTYLGVFYIDKVVSGQGEVFQTLS